MKSTAQVVMERQYEELEEIKQNVRAKLDQLTVAIEQGDQLRVAYLINLTRIAVL